MRIGIMYRARKLEPGHSFGPILVTGVTEFDEAVAKLRANGFEPLYPYKRPNADGQPVLVKRQNPPNWI